MDNKPVPAITTEDNGFNKTTIAIMIGVVIIGACALVFLAFTWFRPDAGSLIAEYFPSPTPTRQPTATLAPTRTPAPDRHPTGVGQASRTALTGECRRCKKHVE